MTSRLSPSIYQFGLMLVTVSLLSLVIAGCSTNPVTGRSQLMLVPESSAISASQEAFVAMLEPIREEGRVNADRATVTRVHGITELLVAQAVRYRPETADWDWEMVVIRDEQANAFAMAGGKMAIYTGIIEKLDLTDAELAQIIGHEIAHALSGHTAEKMSVALASQLGLTAFAISGNRSQAALTGAALGASVAVQLPHSRRMESEADRVGIELAARSGFDPNAAPSLWGKMASLGGGGPAFLSTHPAPQARQSDLAGLAQQMWPLYEQARRDGSLPRHPVR